LFWLAVVGCAYSYVLYPLLLQLMPVHRRVRNPGAWVPRVSLIIACRNEARRLRHKLDNALSLDYPDIEILVCSDASDDGSDEIVAGYADRGVRLVRSGERRGKEHAQGLAIAAAGGEILVFSDAGTDLPADSIRHIVDDLADPGIGAVSSEDRFISADNTVVGEGAYVRYEMWLRRLESERAGLVGLSGSFFAVRRSILRGWDASIPSDFACALQAVRAGTRAISDPRVVGIYRDIKDPGKEYARKIRTAVRGMSALAHLSEVLNPFRYGWFSFQVWGHKLMRWMVPWFMLLLLFSSVWLAPQGGVYAAACGMQLIGYAVVAVCHRLPSLQRFTLLRLGYFFVQVNMALAAAGIAFLRGRRIVIWEPSAR
jgi:cellulose synthase/poly-beta-1,6-N-acetylglucosamine synthase-like glycosyltransferase